MQINNFNTGCGRRSTIHPGDAESGADLVEIGIPFFDPTAEGVVSRKRNIRSLGNGIDKRTACSKLRRVTEQSQIPLAFMTYVNPVFHYGYEKFFTKCEELGISAIIIPDVPYEEKAEVEAPAKTHGVKVISMIAPTSESRIRQIASEAEGFIYVVSCHFTAVCAARSRPICLLSWKASAP